MRRRAFNLTSTINRLAANAPVQLAVLVALIASGCSGKSDDAIHVASPRLRLVAVLYSRYMGGYGGKAPDSADQFAQFINLNERQLLKQYGFVSGEQLLANADSMPRLIVLYGPDRQTNGTRLVAVEESIDGTDHFGVDPLGIVERLTPEAAAPLLVGK